MGESFVATSTAWAIAVVFSAIGVAISSYNIIQHVRHYTAPPLQKDIVRLLFVVPLYGVCSVFSLIFVHSSPYIEVIRDIYEAFVIYCFLNLMMTFGGGEHHMTVELMEYPPMSHPIPLCWLPKIILNTSFMKGVKRGTLQFVVIKLVMATISIALLASGHYENRAWIDINLVIYNIAYSIALYALLLFYMATKEIVSTMSPAVKFFAIKTIVFFTYWQGLIVLLASSDPKEANRWNDFILCMEMPLFAILQYKAFPWYEFQTGIPDKGFLQAAGEVMSVKDVAQDIMHQIKPAYQEYTLNSQATGVVDQQGKYVGSKQKKYKTRTFIIGNLGQEAKTSRRGKRGGASNPNSFANQSRGSLGRDSHRAKADGSYATRPLTERSISEAKNPGSLPDLDFKPSDGDDDGIGEGAIELRDHDLDSDPNCELGDMPTEFPPEINTV